MKTSFAFLFISLLFFLSACISNDKQEDPESESKMYKIMLVPPEDIIIEKDFLYNQHTLEDCYSYKKTIRTFQWEKIREGLFLVDSIDSEQGAVWAILQKNKNGRAAPVKNSMINEYDRITDIYGVQQYQSVPLFPVGEKIAERYGRDGSLVRYISDSMDFAKVQTINFKGEWMVPKKYTKIIHDTISFQKAIFIDKTNQNIITLEKSGSKWLVRSMNPATTGLHKPPYKYETPLGLFVIQEKTTKMVYLADGSHEIGGFAPYASRFSNGAYIHGVPIDEPKKKPVEFSASLGTTPRSHMCVRNATSHAKYVYYWAPIGQTLVFIID